MEAAVLSGNTSNHSEILKNCELAKREDRIGRCCRVLIVNTWIFRLPPALILVFTVCSIIFAFTEYSSGVRIQKTTVTPNTSSSIYQKDFETHRHEKRHR